MMKDTCKHRLRLLSIIRLGDSSTPRSMLHAPCFLMRKGAIILCGGKSSRMGRDKATLPFGPERMLQRVVRLLDSEAIVVVAAPNQSLPELPTGVTVARDIHQFRGPLQGL